MAQLPLEKPARRPRGRPTTNSRMKTLLIARNLLIENPERDLTMGAVAAELGIVTMALYKHVENKNDLLEGVAELVFAEYTDEVSDDAAWQDQIAHWARGVRRFFLDNPYIFKLIGWEKQLSRAWLNFMVTPAMILKQSGLEGKAYIDNLQWLLRALLSHLIMEIAELHSDISKNWAEHSDITALDKGAFEVLNPILHKLQSNSIESQFEFLLKQLIVGLEHSVPTKMG